jgi:hypothetical protein
MKSSWLLAVGVLVPSSAWAFCGTYVGSPDAELLSGASQVVLARQGSRTVLTLANDVEGNVKDFALVLPIPEVVDAEAVRVLDRAVLDRIGEYAGTRLVTYTCEDFAGQYDGRSSGCSCCPGCSEFTLNGDFSGSASPPSLDVEVEAEFAAGEYDIVVLSSEDSADLLTWLNREGYAVSPEAEDLLGDYIRAGSKFLAAKVRLDDVPVTGGPEGRPYLSPLQITYTSPTFSLPIRLGTLNSPGWQDVLVYTLTSEERGTVGISNYPQVELPNDCMYDPDRHGALNDYLDQSLQTAVEAEDGAAWARTYTWSSSKCDPCPPGGELSPEDAQTLGYDAGTPQVTRLWARYSPEAATQDLMLYTDGDFSPSYQLRYITYDPDLESTFLICGDDEFPEDPGTCKGNDQAAEANVAPTAGIFATLGTVLLASLLRRRRP